MPLGETLPFLSEQHSLQNGRFVHSGDAAQERASCIATDAGVQSGRLDFSETCAADETQEGIIGIAFAPPLGETRTMATLTEDMKRLVRQQRLGFYATVCEDGSPNLSPKGTTYVLDDDHLFFADIRSPQTVANIRRGSLVEINVVDPLTRKGYRFKGLGAVHDPGTTLFADGIEQLREAGSTLVDRVKAIVVIEVREARQLVSPVYDDGTLTEAEIIRRYRAHFASLDAGAAADS